MDLLQDIAAQIVESGARALVAAFVLVLSVAVLLALGASLWCFTRYVARRLPLSRDHLLHLKSFALHFVECHA